MNVLFIYWPYAILVVVAVAIVFQYYVRRCSRKIQENNLVNSEKLAKNLFEQTRWERRAEWIGYGEFRFLYLIVGEGNPRREVVWARVVVSETRHTVIVEHSSSARAFDKEFAQLFVASLKKHNIEAVLVSGTRDQPDLTESGINVIG